MIRELDRLRDMGAQKIYEDTHISLKHVQSIIHESFEDLTKIQFLGFVSILEREYNEDLSALRQLGFEYFKDQKAEEYLNPTMFINEDKKNNFSFFYVVLVLSILAGAIYFSFDFTPHKTSEQKIDNTTIDNATYTITQKLQKTIVVLETNVTDINTTLPVTIEKDDHNLTVLDKNLTTQVAVVLKIQSKPKIKTDIVKKVQQQKHKKALTPLVIRPRTKVWIGYINKTDKEKHQAVVKHILTLNPNKIWLLSMGHGNVNITLNSKTKKYSSAKSVRFIYKNAKLTKLSVNEFKKLNNGRLW